MKDNLVQRIDKKENRHNILGHAKRNANTILWDGGSMYKLIHTHARTQVSSYENEYLHEK